MIRFCLTDLTQFESNCVRMIPKLSKSKAFCSFRGMQGRIPTAKTDLFVLVRNISCLICLLASFAYAEVKMDTLYKSGEFLKACEYGASIWRKYETDEQFMMVFGNSCLEADYIDYLSVPAVRLNKTKESREAAALYATLITKKKLLLMAMVDGADISNLVLPKLPHPLSVAFDKMVAKELKNSNGIWVDSSNDFNISVVKSPKFDNILTILITQSNGTKRIMYK